MVATVQALRWRRLQHDLMPQIQAALIEAKLRTVLKSWYGTKYQENQQAKQFAVDCVRFVAGVLDEMYGRVRTLPANLPADRSLHDIEGSKAAMRALLRLYQPTVEVWDGAVEPGDIVVTGPPGGGPGHALIVGPDPMQFWHVDPNAGVCYTGAGMTKMQAFRVYRPEDKYLWLK